MFAWTHQVHTVVTQLGQLFFRNTLVDTSFLLQSGALANTFLQTQPRTEISLLRSLLCGWGSGSLLRWDLAKVNAEVTFYCTVNPMVSIHCHGAVPSWQYCLIQTPQLRTNPGSDQDKRLIYGAALGTSSSKRLHCREVPALHMSCPKA